MAPAPQQLPLPKSMPRQITRFTGGPIFDGTGLITDAVARFDQGVFAGLDHAAFPGPDQTAGVIDLHGDILSPGYVDLQVNGGGGVMLNDAPDLATLIRIAAAHRAMGTTAFLPTLITDTPQATQAAITAAQEAQAQAVPGVAGLHLEGPHLSQARKGAHDGGLIRPMQAEDLQTLLDAKAGLPVLMVTLAPENATPEQVATLTQAGVIVSLGHSDCSYETALAYVQAGARCATHLFNAMSPLTSRAPGLVGAVLAQPALCAGVIADGIHVHPAALRTAWAAKAGHDGLFLVSDAMAVAGTDLTEFRLNGRRVLRRQGRLTLEDGTLAGADLDLTCAVRVLVQRAGVPLADALRAAITIPAAVIGQGATLQTGQTPLSGMIRIASDLSGARPVMP